MLLSNREPRCRRSICFRTTNRRQRCRRSLRTADSSVTCCARSGSEPSALLHYRAAISRSAAGLGCVKTQTCCDAVEWCSQGSDVHHLSREVRLSALTERRCRNLDNSEILALLARAYYHVSCREVIWWRVGIGFQRFFGPCTFSRTQGHVWTAPLRQVLSWRGDDCGRVQSCVWPVGAAILHDCWP